jgi:hypothetical protein
MKEHIRLNDNAVIPSEVEESPNQWQMVSYQGDFSTLVEMTSFGWDDIATFYGKEYEP